MKGTYKVRNETKRNEINENETKRNQQKRNETKRNQRNENEIKTHVCLSSGEDRICHH